MNQPFNTAIVLTAAFTLDIENLGSHRSRASASVFSKRPNFCSSSQSEPAAAKYVE
jgi:hypothetical protein